ncbi:sensor histidine kinase [Clostridium oryzae]|uniref:histidine kinase n=1 Tax=Clostridium oryzae TaxID=1450648 RepID=A0A1V4ILC7_9CLOT|nr:sensor histidine kinase [Clostridium oryzae]OPJ60736.1 sensor histidine kinase GraS [Clostridium oryzae]
MSLYGFLKDKIIMLLVNLMSMLAMFIFLIATGTEAHVLVLVLIFWLLILTVYIAIQYYYKKKYFDNLFHTVNQLKQKYLIAEIMEKPYDLENLQFYNILKSANKSMIENITSIKNERKAYKEYIESWVHEIKTPIASIKLICENNKNDVIRRILSELESVDNFVEQVLFYARSENVEKDYLIKETQLSNCINAAVVKNKQLLLRNGIRIDVTQSKLTAFTDSKWIEFILNQLIINAVKYRKECNAIIEILVSEEEKGVAIFVKDNGVGIDESELPRVFEKGFTGSNGRKNDKSTGIGLYLSKKLCEKLGIGISISSKLNEYTSVRLFFPKGTFVKIN